MNMNVSKSKTKLFAAIAILAMVVCAFAIAIPSENVDAVTTPGDAEDISSGILLSSIIEPGDYKLTADYTLDEDDSIADGVNIFTDGHKIITSGHTLTISQNGVLNVNNGGMLVLTDIKEVEIQGKVVVDTTGFVNIATADDKGKYIGAGGKAVVTSGTVEIVDKEDTGFNVTLTSGSTATLNNYSLYTTDTITISQNATLTITGIVSPMGGDGGKIVNNGTINFSGSGKVTKTTIDDSGTGTINGYLVGTDYGSAEALEINTDAVNKDITINGTDNTDYKLVSGGSISVAKGGQYSGTVTYVYSDNQDPVKTAYTQSVDLVIPTAASDINDVVTIANNALAIVGTMDGTKTTANVAIAGASQEHPLAM